MAAPQERPIMTNAVAVAAYARRSPSTADGVRSAFSQSLSYSHGTSLTPLLGETVGESLERTAARFPDVEALVECASGRRWTYTEFNVAVDEVALGLLDLGVE